MCAYKKADLLILVVSFSKLVVNHFSAWDGSKEWQTEMVENEDILSVTIGIGWVAVATDLRNLRIFTMAGVQRDVLSIPGPVVCLAGFDKNIMVVFHNGIGRECYQIEGTFLFYFWVVGYCRCFLSTYLSYLQKYIKSSLELFLHSQIIVKIKFSYQTQSTI